LAKPTRKDLPAKATTIKGGKIDKLATNHNLTLVRAAKPAKDLPPRKDVKAGKKAL
jgi:hypothetical protein